MGDGEGVEQLGMGVGVRLRQDSDTETSGRELTEYLEVTGLESDSRSDAAEDACLVESGTKTGAQRQAYQRSALEFSQSNAGFGRPRVRMGDGSYEWLLFDDLGFDSSGGADYRANPCQVELSRSERVQQVAGGGLAKGQFDRGVVVVEAGEEAR